MLEQYPEIFESINTKILKFLSYKSRSEKEVVSKLNDYLLREKNLTPVAKDFFSKFFISKLKELNLIDDYKYAKSFVKEKIDSPKPTSKIKVKIFLRKKGISEEIINNAVKDFSRDLEISNAKKDANKKFKILKNKKDTPYLKHKINNYLLSKGYPIEIISSVVDTLSDVK